MCIEFIKKQKILDLLIKLKYLWKNTVMKGESGTKYRSSSTPYIILKNKCKIWDAFL
jgi:hypothetical protein